MSRPDYVTGAFPALCVNKNCRRDYWYFPEGGFDQRLKEPIEPGPAPKYCRSCGRQVLSACPGCDTKLDRLPTQEEPFCERCGTDLLSVEMLTKAGPKQLPR